MKKSKKYFLMVLLVLTLICIFGAYAIQKYQDMHQSNISTYSVAISEHEWSEINAENSSYESKDDLIKTALNYVEQIIKITGKNDWEQIYKSKHGEDYIVNIEIYLIKQSSHVSGGYNSYKELRPMLYLNSNFVELGMDPLAHELTHLVCQKYSSLNLREGLADYIQNKIDKPSVFNYGGDPDILARYYLDGLDETFISSIGGTEVNNNYTNGKLRPVFYITSASFSKYIIDKYGMEKFMQLYESENLHNDYTTILGLSLEELKTDWINYIKSKSTTDAIKETEEKINTFGYEKGFKGSLFDQFRN